MVVLPLRHHRSSAIFRFAIQPGMLSVRQSKRIRAVETTAFSAHGFCHANLAIDSFNLPQLTLYVLVSTTGEWLCKIENPSFMGPAQRAPCIGGHEHESCYYTYNDC